MPESMLEMMRKKRLANAIRSVSVSESNEQLIHNKSNAVKEKLGHTCKLDEEKLYIQQLSYHFYSMQASYSGKPLRAVTKESKKRQDYWGRVQDACKKSGVPPDRYIKAQFQFFHHAFGTTPKLCNLATEAAIDRARSYEGKTEGSVVSSAIEATVDLGSLFSRCDKQVRDVCRNRNITREDYYRTFVVTKLIPMPQQFLNADPVYRGILDEASNLHS